MIELSENLQREIERRLAEGKDDSPDALLARAFRALDHASQASEYWLDSELLKGLEGTPQVLDDAALRAARDEAAHNVARRREARG